MLPADEDRCVSFTLSEEAFLRGIDGFNMTDGQRTWRSSVQSVHQAAGKVVVIVRVQGYYPFMDTKLREHAESLEKADAGDQAA